MPNIVESPHDIKTRENTKSLLLQLPLEIKTRIYELVCGGQTIHVVHDGRHVGYYFIPASRFSQRKRLNGYSGYQEHHEDENRPRTRLETSILRCCKQLFMEAEFVPYTANAFSFASAASLKQFCSKLPERYHTKIHSLCLLMSVSNVEDFQLISWERAFRAVTSFLKGLRRLHVGLEVYPGSRGGVHRRSRVLDGILKLGKLDLRSATVVLWDDDFWDNRLSMRWVQSERWTLTQKQEWSHYLRTALLHYGDRDSELARIKREALEEGRLCRLCADTPRCFSCQSSRKQCWEFWKRCTCIQSSGGVFHL